MQISCPRYLYMAVSAHEMKLIKKEWAGIFDKLPTDGTASVADPKDALKFRELSRFQDRRAAARNALERNLPPTQAAEVAGRVAAGAAVSAALENPPVDPLTGLGHTAAEKAKETRMYQAYVRKSQTCDDFPAVFQGDYLILTPPGMRSSQPKTLAPNPPTRTHPAQAGI